MIDVERLKHDRDYWDSKDPTGGEATHYCADGGANPWIKEGHVWEDKQGRWREVRLKNYDMQNPIPRPARKQWSGPEDGLPPIGSECTIEDNGRLKYGADHAGKAMEVVAHVENCAVLRLDWGLGCFELSVLRPLRTEKERVVEAAIGNVDGSVNCLELYCRREFLGRCYEAGFLKMPENDQ